jgi:hypothetical protein
MLALGGFYSMNPFDVGFWVLAVWIVCRLLDPTGDRRWWWGLGIAFGLGILNKYSMIFLGVGLAAGILLSPLRRELLSRNRVLGSSIVFVIVLPHLLWQFANDWASLEFIRNAREHKNLAMSPPEFWQEQLLMAHPGFTPVWLLGLGGLLLAPRLKTWRPLGIAFLVIGAWLTLQKAKPYYLVPAYPMIMAAGAVAITHWLSRWRRLSKGTAIGLPIFLAIQGLLIAPLAIPLLSPERFVAWEQTLGLRPRDMEVNQVGVLPQHFADRFGWEGLAQSVSGVVEALPADERGRCLVFTDNYGECGAINYWGLPEGAPAAVSGHNSCYSWWPADFEPSVYVAVGESRERWELSFEEVELATVHHDEQAMPFEQEIAIWLCRKPVIPHREFRQRQRFAI